MKTSTWGKRRRKAVDGLLADQAAHQGDHRVGPRLLGRTQPAEPAVDPILGLLAHDAGVEHDHVGRLDRVGPPIAHALQLAAQTLAVGGVHLDIRWSRCDSA